MAGLTALVVHEPSVAMNAVTSRILVVDTVTARHPGTVVAETSKRHRIKKIEWNPDGQSITYLSGREGADELWNIPVTGGEPQRVLDDLERAVRIGGSPVLLHH